MNSFYLPGCNYPEGFFIYKYKPLIFNSIPFIFAEPVCVITGCIANFILYRF